MLFFISLFLSILLIALVRKHFQTSSPAAFFTYYWCTQVLVMVTFWHDFLLFNYHGVIFILLCVACFDIGYAANGLKTCGPNYSITRYITYIPQTSIRVYLIVIVLAFFNVFYGIARQGFSLSNLLNFSDFLAMSNQASIDRYSGEAEIGGVLSKALGINAYACPLIGGMMFYYFGNKQRWKSYISILPMIIAGLSQGVKMGIITGTFLYAIGIVISSKILNKKIEISFKKLLMIGVIAIGFVAILAITMMFRIGKFDLDTLIVVSEKVVSYALGHLPAFDIWFESSSVSIFDLTFGGKTFYGITNTLGILERKSGIYEQMLTISNNDDMTNVYTAFRMIVEDFGYIGSFIYMFFIGYVVKYCYYAFLRKQNFYFMTSLICLIYFYIAWSMVTSIFAYATYICLFFYLIILLKFIFRVHVKQTNNIKL